MMMKNKEKEERKEKTKRENRENREHGENSCRRFEVTHTSWWLS